MDKRKNLHFKRITEGCDKISEFKQGSENSFSPTFKAWRDSMEQSLGELFGQDHDYTKRFSRLSFWVTRISMGKVQWSSQDQHRFTNDLSLADQVLNDAIEEFEIAPTVQGSILEGGASNVLPSIVVNVNNVLSQAVEIDINQVITSLDSLNLSPKDRIQTEKHAKALSEEVKGQQRWPILAKSLEALRAMGKSAYEQVAIPLILDMLKKQSGL